MIPELTLYRIGAVAMAATTVAFLLWLVRKRPAHRRVLLAIPFVCATLALAYVGMSLELLRMTSEDGVAMPMSRFVDYLIAWPIMVVVAGMVAGAKKRQTFAVALAIAATIASVILAWYVPDPLTYVAFASAVVGYLLSAYGLLRPMAARARQQSGERAVLFAKLRNLLLLLWGCYLLLGVITRQGLGILDAFTGVFIAVYLDAIIRIGFGVILFRATTATSQIVSRSGSGTRSSDSPADGETPTDAVAD